MKFLKQILNFYIKFSIHIGLAVFSLVQITCLSMNISIFAALKIFIFFGTILGYNFLKYGTFFQKNNLIIKENLLLIFVSILSFAGACYFFIQLQRKVQFLFILMGFMVFIYPFLRKYGIIKMFLVSFCIALITVYIPSFSKNILIYDYHIILIQRFLIIVCLLIPFEILDSKNDPFAMQTLPQHLGVKKTKFFGLVLLVLFCVLEIFFNNRKEDYKFLLLSFFIAIVIALFIIFANTKRSKYYTSFWVESIPIFWWILLLIFR